MDTNGLYDFPQVVKQLNQRWQKVRHAVDYKRLVEPIRIGQKTLLFNPQQIEVLPEYFAQKGKVKV
jgi:predicted component of type VI protein secretion system